METWRKAGRRIKGDWSAMLGAMRSRSRAKVKLPFVPLRVSGRTLDLVLRDFLKALLGSNPSLLTVIVQDDGVVKAYAEDASGGVYEKLERLSFEPGAGREDLVALARGAGVEIGVVKEADTRFFELFEDEPEDLLDALALLVSGVARSLREGWLRFTPGPPFVELAKVLGLSRESLRFILARALPEGRYGIGFSCSGGGCALVAEVTGETCKAEETDVAARAPGPLARELVEEKDCGAAVALSLPDVAALLEGRLPLAEFVGGRGGMWGLSTRSGLEGLLHAVRWVGKLLAIEHDLQECNVSLKALLDLARGYLESARRYAREKGVGVKLVDGDESLDLAWDDHGVRELEAPGPLTFDLALVRRAISAAASDPLQAVRRFVPREVMDEVSYTTAVALIECERPRGRLLLFGGPHGFFRRAWEGDSCAVFLDGEGRAHVDELPSKTLSVEDGGRRVSFAGERMQVELHFERVRSRSDPHGAGRFLGEGKLGKWAPGLELERGLYRLVSGRAEIDEKKARLGWGWMYLEAGRGRLLRWPFGATWVYSSWLMPSGECGSGVHAAPMLGASTPPWLRTLMEEATDGAVALAPDGDAESVYEHAVEPGPPARIIRDSARAAGRELGYRVLSAAIVPFDEDGQAIFRLRCLCGEGAGLVEIPASFPGLLMRPEPCELAFSEETISLRVSGRELLSVQTDGREFLAPYLPPVPGRLRRMARAATKLLRRG